MVDVRTSTDIIMKFRMKLILIWIFLLSVTNGIENVCQENKAIMYVPSIPDPQYNASDNALLNVLLSGGMNVEVVIINTTSLPPEGVLTILPASNLDSAAQNMFYLSNPAIVFNRGIWSSMGLTSTMGSYVSGLTNMTFVNVSHPVSEGISLGSNRLVTSPQTFYQANELLPPAISIATTNNVPSVFAVDVTGGRGRRVGIGLAATDFQYHTEISTMLLLNSVKWLCAQGIVPPVPPPQPIMPNRPQQMHLSYGVSPDIMVVSWEAPLNAPKYSLPNATAMLWYGVKGGKMMSIVVANITRYEEGNGAFVALIRATLRNLIPGTEYSYSVGWEGEEWKNLTSAEFSFVAHRNSTKWSPR